MVVGKQAVCAVLHGDVRALRFYISLVHPLNSDRPPFLFSVLSLFPNVESPVTLVKLKGTTSPCSTERATCFPKIIIVRSVA